MRRMGLLRTISYASFLSAVVLTISSCGFNKEQGAEEQKSSDAVQNTVNEVPGSMESDAVLDYDIPTQLPGIIADRDGYSSLEDKYVWFVAEEVPAVFNLCDAKNGDIVLEITPSDVKYDEQNECYRAKIDFESITEAGEYYIETVDYGRSYTFEISDTFFEDKFDELLEHEYTRLNDESASLDEVYALLYSYERYGKALPDDGSQSVKLKEVLDDWTADYMEKYADVTEDDTESAENKEETDKEETDKSETDKEETDKEEADKSEADKADTCSLTDEEKCMLAAVLARYYYVSVKTDDGTVTDHTNRTYVEALEEAQSLYEEIREADIPEDVLFLALSELYRCTGDKEYSDEILRLEVYLTNLDDTYGSKYILWGAMTYMMTDYTVSRSLCDALMQDLLDSCEEISKEKELLAPYNPKREDTEVILTDAGQLVAMNYILDGYQYNELITNIVHYTSGRNYEGYMCEISQEYPDEAVIIYAWLTLLEKDGKMSPDAQVIWNYSW